MTAGDLGPVLDLSRVVHPDFPESLAVFEEKFALFPMGCLVLSPADAAPLGYCLSHPWRSGDPPALDTRLGRLPADPDCLFLHDLALSPAVRGQNYGRQALRVLRDLSRLAGLARIELVSVGGAASFWRHNGFTPAGDMTLRAKVFSTYGHGAEPMECTVEPFFG